MKTQTLLFPIVVAAALTQFGCGFALLDTKKPHKTPPLEVDPASVPAIVGDGAEAEIIWASDDSDETVAVSVSVDGNEIGFRSAKFPSTTSATFFEPRTS